MILVQYEKYLIAQKSLYSYTYLLEGETMTLGERVLIVRRRRDMTQRQLAKAAGLNTNTISRLEQGDLKDLGGTAIANVARALGTSADFLLGLSERDEESEQFAAATL